MKIHQAWASLGLIAWAVLATGCALPGSKNPLSDEAESAVDDRLLGQWQMLNEDGAPQPGELIVARVPDHPNLMEVVVAGLDEGGYLQLKRWRLYPTKIGEHTYASQLFEEKEKPDDKHYLIWLYELKDENTVECRLFNCELIAAAIERRELNGHFKRKQRGKDPNEVLPLESIEITAEIKDLAAFVTKHGAGAFDEKGLVFKRVRER